MSDLLVSVYPATGERIGRSRSSESDDAIQMSAQSWHSRPETADEKGLAGPLRGVRHGATQFHHQPRHPRHLREIDLRGLVAHLVVVVVETAGEEDDRDPLLGVVEVVAALVDVLRMGG